MAETTEEYKAISVTLTRKQVEFVTKLRDALGVPVSHTIRKALEKSHPELTQEESQPERAIA